MMVRFTQLFVFFFNLYLLHDILSLAFSLILISGTIMTISKDRVKPSPFPDSWKLTEIFTTGIVLGAYLALMTVIFFYLAYETNFFTVNSAFSLVSLTLSS